MDRWRGSVAIVTGASAGIGAAVCQKLVEEGLQVAGFARRVELVEDLAKTLKGKKGKLYAVKCDVTNQEEIIKSFMWVKENVGPVQILVNNAGVMKLGTIIEGNSAMWKTVLDTNVLGLCMCTKEAFAQMKEAGLDGHIVNINSVAGHEIVTGEPPILNVYSPSKYAVTSLTEVIRKEIASTTQHVKVTSISPGLVKTDIFPKSELDLLENVLACLPALNSEDIAESIVYALSTPRHVHIQEITIRPFGERVELLKAD